MKDKTKKKTYSTTTLILLFIALMVCFALIIFVHSKLSVRNSEQRNDISVEDEQTQPEPTPDVPRDENGNEVEYVFSDVEVLPEGISLYKNAVVSCDIDENIHMTLGVESESADKGIFLNPVLTYDQAVLNDQYIFLIKATRGAIDYVGSPDAGSSDSNKDSRFLYLAGRTYDKLVPAEFKSEDDYGVRWYSTESSEFMEKLEASLYIHAIRLRDGMLMGSVKADLAYDKETKQISITEIKKNDVLETGEFTEEQRTNIIMAAIRFINKGNNKFDVYISENDYNTISHMVVVEHLKTPLYPRFFDAVAQVSPAGRYSQCELYAVHLPIIGYGYITVYFAPADQLVGLPRASMDGDFGGDYAIIGYDALMPFSNDSMLSYLTSEDAELFGLTQGG